VDADAWRLEGGNCLALLFSLLLLLIALSLLCLQDRLLDIIHLPILALIVEGHLAPGRAHHEGSLDTHLPPHRAALV